MAAAICVAARYGVGCRWPVAYLVGVNAAAGAMYALDKHRSRVAGHRVPERTLHLIAAAGGTPAAWLSQRLLRHKTTKPSFQLQCRLIAAAQAVLIVGWYAWRR